MNVTLIKKLNTYAVGLRATATGIVKS